MNSKQWVRFTSLQRLVVDSHGHPRQATFNLKQLKTKSRYIMSSSGLLFEILLIFNCERAVQQGLMKYVCLFWTKIGDGQGQNIIYERPSMYSIPVPVHSIEFDSIFFPILQYHPFIQEKNTSDPFHKIPLRVINVCDSDLLCLICIWSEASAQTLRRD